MKPLLLSLIFISSSFAAIAQNDLRITYYANQGVSGLSGANKVYMYSGAATSAPSGTWEWIIGSPNLDDGVGEMTSLGNDTWDICINPHDYYSQGIGGPIPAGTPVLTISLFFRNEDGTALGFDLNGFVIVLDLTANPVTSTFTGVVPSSCTVGINDPEAESSKIHCYPNPFKGNTRFQFPMEFTGKQFTVSIHDITGKLVSEIKNTAGQNHADWDGTNGRGLLVNNGIYFYTVKSNNNILTGKVAVLR